MNERGIEVKVGILVTVCLALLGAFIFVLGDFGSADGSTLFLDVETSADLKKGAPVKIAGTPSGRVIDVRYMGGQMDETTGKRVWVRAKLSVDAEKIGTLHRDGKFFITTQGVLGEKYVEIDPGTPGEVALKSGDIVQGEPPLRLEIMAANASRVLKTLDRVLVENEAEIGSIIRNANATVTTVRKTVERVDSLIAKTEPKVTQVIDGILRIEGQTETLLGAANVAIGDGTSLKRTVANVERVSRDVRQQLPAVTADARKTLKEFRKVAKSGDVAIGEAKVLVMSGLNQVNSSLAKVDTIVDDAKVLTKRLKDGKGTIGAFLSDKEMYEDIREMMKDLKRHPWKFLWKE